jgi:hypothetical protein
MRLFRKKLGQNEKLLKNIEEYEQKKKTEQQKSKVLGQKPVKGKTNKRKETTMHNTTRV